MFMITAFEIFNIMKFCICDRKNEEEIRLNMFDFNDDIFKNLLSDMPDISYDDDREDNNKVLNAVPASNENDNLVRNEDEKVYNNKNAASNNLDDIDKMLDFLGDIDFDNQNNENFYNSTSFGSSFLDQVAAPSGENIDFCKSPPTKRTKFSEGFASNNCFFSSDKDDFVAHSTINSDNFSISSLRTFEIERELSLAADNLRKKLLYDIRQHISTINSRMENLENVIEKKIRFDFVYIIMKDFNDLFLKFIETQEGLIGKISSQTETLSGKDTNFVEYLNTECLKFTSKKSVEELNQEYVDFAKNMEPYFHENMKISINSEVLGAFNRILASYLRAISNFENILISDSRFINFYFKNEYSERAYKVFDFSSDRRRILNACMNSKAIYLIYGTSNDSLKSYILKIPYQEKSIQPEIFKKYSSKDLHNKVELGKACRRILTDDSENRIYILQKDKETVILVLDEFFLEVDTITPARIKNDASMLNDVFIADISLHENKLYLLDSNNPYIYCYDLNLEYENKIKIPGEFSISNRECHFSFLQNYIFIVSKKSFFAFIPNTDLCVESKNVFKNMLVEANGFSLVCPSEDIIAVLTRKSIHLSMLKVESEAESLRVKHSDYTPIYLTDKLNDTRNYAILKSPYDCKLKIVYIRNGFVGLIEYN